MRSNSGQCVDVVRAFNGNDASGDAYKTGLLTKDPCCYPSAMGQQLMAELVAETGFQDCTPEPKCRYRAPVGGTAS
jgi:hypothetical protein